MQYLGASTRQTVVSVARFFATLPPLCREMYFSLQSQLPLAAERALTLCAGYQRWVEGCFEKRLQRECLCPLLLHLLRWAASDQPEPRLERAGAASNPMFKGKAGLS